MKNLFLLSSVLLLMIMSCGENRGSTADVMQCRANLRGIASQEVLFYAEHGRYTNDLDNLNSVAKVCPACGEEYWLTANGDYYKVECPCGHGAIENGLAGWDNSAR